MSSLESRNKRRLFAETERRLLFPERESQDLATSQKVGERKLPKSGREKAPKKWEREPNFSLSWSLTKRVAEKGRFPTSGFVTRTFSFRWACRANCIEFPRGFCEYLKKGFASSKNDSRAWKDAPQRIHQLKFQIMKRCTNGCGEFTNLKKDNRMCREFTSWNFRVWKDARTGAYISPIEEQALHHPRKQQLARGIHQLKFQAHHRMRRNSIADSNFRAWIAPRAPIHQFKAS